MGKRKTRLRDLDRKQAHRERPRLPSGFDATAYAELMRALRLRKDPTLALVARLAVHTGARLGEILSAEWIDFDLENRVWKLRDGKRLGRSRIVPLSDSALRVLGALRRRLPGQRVAGCSRDAVAASFAAIARRHAGRRFHFHHIRNEAKRRMNERGFAATDVALILGQPPTPAVES